MDQYEFIRMANRNYGKGIRQIAREYGHSRKTVRKALAGLDPVYRMKTRRKSPVMDRVHAVVDQWLREDENAPRKQRHTAKRIYDRLVADYDFTGAEVTVRRYVRERRKSMGLGKIEAMVPLISETPGEAEVDWGEAVVTMAGQRRKVKLFIMRPRFSGKPFVRAYPNESQEMFFDGHVRAFAYYGGVFPVIVYDNLRAAVARVLKGRRREEQRAFQQFRAYYTFTSRFCNVARGNEKGGVEGLVAYARRNLLVPIPEVADFDDLNRLLAEGCDRLSERILGGREERRTIADRFAEEQCRLLALPAKPFAVGKVLQAKVDKYQTVRVAGVRYSAPTMHVGMRVGVTMGCETVTIAANGQAIARHKRGFQPGAWVLDPHHYLDLLYRKPGSMDRARPLQQWRRHWPGSHDRLWERLRAKHGDREGGRAFLDVLMLYRKGAAGDVEAAIDLAVDQGIHDAASIQCLLRTLQSPEQAVGALSMERLPSVCRTTVHAAPDLCKYDRLGGGQ
jgi:transposase